MLSKFLAKSHVNVKAEICVVQLMQLHRRGEIDGRLDGNDGAALAAVAISRARRGSFGSRSRCTARPDGAARRRPREFRFCLSVYRGWSTGAGSLFSAPLSWWLPLFLLASLGLSSSAYLVEDDSEQK